MMMSLTTLRRLTNAAAGCYVIAAAILLPVVCCLATEAAKDADARENNPRPTASQAALPSAIFENSSPNSYANRPSVPSLPTTPVSPGSGSTPPETNSFTYIAAGFSSSKAYADDDDVDKTQSKVTKENNISRDSITSRNDTPSSIDVIWTTASHAEAKQVATETAEQLVHSPEDGSNSRSRPKVTSRSEAGSRTTDYFLAVIGGSCCSTSDVRKATTTDRYDDDNNYNDDDDDDENNDENNGDSNAGRRDDAYGYSDRGDDSQTYEDYRGGVMDEEDGDGGGGGGGGGGSDESRSEYLYVSDNFTTNDSQVDPENQDLQQDSNSEYNDDYNPSSDHSRDQSRDQPADHGQRFRASDDYEAEMRGGVHRGQLISLRWLEHHPINHFAVFLWLVVALALVSILMLAYRFRHSVINAIQCTKTNYKQGKRFGVEEANDLLSNAQV